MFGLGKRTLPRVVAFDIIGTLFPLDPLRADLVALGLPPAGLELWYATAEREACALALTGDYATFATLLEQSLATILAEQRLPPPDGAAKPIVEKMATLPPRAGAHEALAMLRAAAVPVMALTNGTEKTTRAMLEHGGLAGHFGEIVSTDTVKRAKPAREVYLKAAKVAGVEPQELTLIAAHPWDMHGAGSAGLGTAFLDADRPAVPAFRKPLLTASTLPELARALLEV